MFIEAIPNLQTRLFVRRFLANLWIYRRRFGQRAPPLEAIAAGRFPCYRPIDGEERPSNSHRIRTARAFSDQTEPARSGTPQSNPAAVFSGWRVAGGGAGRRDST